MQESPMTTSTPSTMIPIHLAIFASGPFAGHGAVFVWPATLKATDYSLAPKDSSPLAAPAVVSSPVFEVLANEPDGEGLRKPRGDASPLSGDARADDEEPGLSRADGCSDVRSRPAIR